MSIFTLARRFEIKLAQIAADEQNKIKYALDSARQNVAAASRLEDNGKILSILYREKFKRAEQNFYDALNVTPATLNSIQIAKDQVNWMMKSSQVFGVIPAPSAFNNSSRQVWNRIESLLKTALNALDNANQLLIDSFQSGVKSETITQLQPMETPEVKVQPAQPLDNSDNNQVFLWNQSTKNWKQMSKNFVWNTAPIGSILKSIENNKESFYRKTGPSGWSALFGNQIPEEV